MIGTKKSRKGGAPLKSSPKKSARQTKHTDIKKVSILLLHTWLGGVCLQSYASFHAEIYCVLFVFIRIQQINANSFA